MQRWQGLRLVDIFDTWVFIYHIYFQRKGSHAKIIWQSLPHTSSFSVGDGASHSNFLTNRLPQLAAELLPHGAELCLHLNRALIKQSQNNSQPANLPTRLLEASLENKRNLLLFCTVGHLHPPLQCFQCGTKLGLQSSEFQ